MCALKGWHIALTDARRGSSCHANLKVPINGIITERGRSRKGREKGRKRERGIERKRERKRGRGEKGRERERQR